MIIKLIKLVIDIKKKICKKKYLPRDIYAKALIDNERVKREEIKHKSWAHLW